MELFLYIFFIILAYYGFLGILIPQEQRAVTWFTFKVLPFKLWGFIIISLGVFLFRSAELFILPLFIYLFSFLFIIDGFLFFLLPKERIKRILHSWLLLPNYMIKIISIFYVLLAFVFFFLMYA